MLSCATKAMWRFSPAMNDSSLWVRVISRLAAAGERRVTARAIPSIYRQPTQSPIGATIVSRMSLHDPRSGRPPSGTQYRIAHGELTATITEIGAAVREFRSGEYDVFQPYGEAEFSSGFHGSVLIPWPNRLADGQYQFDGVDYQVAITEPSRMTALHGLSPWRSWSVVEGHDDRVSLRLELLPSPGYLFLDTAVEYQLGQRASGDNDIAQHRRGRLPLRRRLSRLLSAGDATLDECMVRLDAGRRFVTDDRVLPIGEEAVAGTAFDFRDPRLLGDSSSTTRLPTSCAGQTASPG